MRRTDHILAITSALLTSPKEQFETALATVRESYELSELRKTGAVSWGVIVNNQEYSFEHWLRDARKKKVQRVSFFYLPIQHQGMAPHMAAAFAGTSDLLMEVKTETESQVFKLETYFSSQYQINAEQFISILNAQPDQQLVWSRAAELILQSNRLNSRTIFDPTEIIPYLQSAEGKHVFEYQASDLIKEIQIECSINNKPFVIPDEFKALFVKYDNPFGFDDDREYVYLYALRDVTSEDILILAEAQSFEPEIWEQLNKIVAEWQDETMPPMPVEQWKGKIMSYDFDMLQRIVNHVCRSIAKLCEDKKLLPIIPPALAETFGPNEEDRKRANARSKGEKDRWSLQPNTQPWEYYAFRKLEVDNTTHVDSDEVQSKFISSLKEIQAFATEIQSPYEGAFSLALFILNDLKSFEQAQVEKQLKEANFSEQASNAMLNQLWVADQFGKLGFSEKQIKGLMALSVADVFGGMGSWNDQYVENDYEHYQAVSANMFEAMKDYFTVVISSR